MDIDNMTIEELRAELKKHMVCMKKDLSTLPNDRFDIYMFKAGLWYEVTQDEGGAYLWSPDHKYMFDLYDIYGEEDEYIIFN